MTEIEWTHRPGTKGETWNPVVGCSILSPGCTNCYAMRFAGFRLDREGGPRHYRGITQPSKAGPVWSGKIAIAPDEVWRKPLRWKAPRTIFVGSMNDLFHASIPDEVIDRAFAIMALCPQHTFQVLTKRSARMRAYLSMARAHPVALAAMAETLHGLSANPKSQVGDGLILQGDIAHLKVWPLPNVWLGVSAERQQEANLRIPDLLATPAAVRFLSAEPLLEPIDLTNLDTGRQPSDVEAEYLNAFTGERVWEDDVGVYSANRPLARLDQVIVGGESGRGARGMLRSHALALRDQCEAASAPFFFKQWGEWIDADEWLLAIRRGPAQLTVDGRPWAPTDPLTFDQAATLARMTGRDTFEHHSDGTTLIRVGKRAAGRHLAGQTYSGFPEVAAHG